MKNQKLLIAAVAGIMAVATTRARAADAKAQEVQCYGINGCGSQAKCSVTQEDLDAVKKLVGAKAYGERFGKSEVHSCGSHAKCGASHGFLNWMPASAAECHQKGGLLIEGVPGKRVAKQA
jgi:hypothetical protein